MALINVRSTASRVDVLKQLIANAERTLTLVKGMDRHFRELTQHPEAEYGTGSLTGQMADQADAITSMMSSIESLSKIDVSLQQWHLFAGMNDRVETLWVERRTVEAFVSTYIWFEDWKAVNASVVYWLGANDEILVEIPSIDYKSVRTVNDVVLDAGEHQHKVRLVAAGGSDALDGMDNGTSASYTAGSITLLKKEVT